MKAEQIIKIMESHYPLSCQEDWDHCGLQAGNIHTEVNKIMIGLDASESVYHSGKGKMP